MCKMAADMFNHHCVMMTSLMTTCPWATTERPEQNYDIVYDEILLHNFLENETFFASFLSYHDL